MIHDDFNSRGVDGVQVHHASIEQSAARSSFSSNSPMISFVDAIVVRPVSARELRA